jgi:hypothetical protein
VVSRYLAPSVYVILGLAVAGPLLGPGYVLAVDLAQTPHPNIPDSYWGLLEGSPRSTLAPLPLDALFAGLGVIHGVQVGQKLLLVSAVFLAGWGMHRLVRTRSPAAAVFAGLLYAVNPFVYDRLYTGQWALVFGYALLPHAYGAFRSILEGRRRVAWGFGALFAATAVASTHMALLLLVLCVASLMTWSRKIRYRAEIGGWAIAGLLLAVLLSLYWLVPTPGIADFWGQVSQAQLALFRTVGDRTWGLIPAVAGLYGYWNNPFPIKAYLPAWPVFTLTLLALAGWGLWLRRRDPTTVAVAAAAVFGFLLALGDASEVTRGIFGFFLEHFPFARSFREPQKGVALLAFGYAFLSAGAVDEMLKTPPRQRWVRIALTGILLAFPLVGGYRVLGGNDLRLSHFPASWEEANHVLKAQASESRTLFLPWHGYFPLGFAHNALVANMGASFFQTPVLASRSVGDEPQLADTSNPVERYVKGLLDQGTRLPSLSACLAPLGVSHILLAKESDWHRYRFLDRRRDVVAVRRWPNLVLYRVRAPAGLVMAAPARRGRCTDRLRPLTIRRKSRVTYEVATPPPPSRLVVGLPRRDQWRLNRRELHFEPWAAYRRNYILGLAGGLVFLGSFLLMRSRRGFREDSPESRDSRGL